MTADMVTHLKPVMPSAPVDEFAMPEKHKTKTKMSFMTNLAFILVMLDVLISIVSAFPFFVALLTQFFDSECYYRCGNIYQNKKLVVGVLLDFILLAGVHIWKAMQIFESISRLSAKPLRWLLPLLRVIVVYNILGLLLFLCDRAFGINSLATSEAIVPITFRYGLAALYFYVEYRLLTRLQKKLRGPLPEPTVVVVAKRVI